MATLTLAGISATDITKLKANGYYTVGVRSLEANYPETRTDPSLRYKIECV